MSSFFDKLISSYKNHSYKNRPEYLPCEFIGDILGYYQIKNHPEPQFTWNEKEDGKMYLHDGGIEIHGDCYFRISELNQKDKPMYEHIRREYLINKKL